MTGRDNSSLQKV